MKSLLGLVLAVALFPFQGLAQEIPIEDFFRDSEFSTVELSPDGRHIAVTTPAEDRTLLAVLRVSDRQVVGKWDYGRNRHFRRVLWVNNERLLFWITEKTGRFDFEVGTGDLYASNIDGTRRIDIPNGGYYHVVDMLRDDRQHIMVSRSIERAFLFKLNVDTGRIITEASSSVDGGSFLVDHAGKVRYVFGEMEDGRQVTYRREDGDWKLAHESGRAGATYLPLGFAEDNRRAYFLKGDDGRAQSVVLVDPESQEEVEVSNDGTVDPSGLLWSSDGKTLLGVSYEDGTPRWDFVAPEHPESKVFAGLVNAFEGKGVVFDGVSQDGRYIAVRAYSDGDPGQAFLFDRQAGSATYLLGFREWIKPEQMSPTRPVSVQTRDGKTIHGYLTTPRGSDGRNLPMIVNPHGGPHGVRDTWGFNPEVQLFANRGYAVLQMNFRGSGGYGNAFMRDGFRNWGTSMQDDLTDSVQWAIREGIADRDRVCIYGASYGGYAALMSVVREPDLYQCTVGYVGVYSLPMMFAKGDIPRSRGGRFFQRDILPEGTAAQQANSPAFNVDKIKVPIMLVHGRQDERVPIAQMDFLIAQLKAAGKAPEDVVVEAREGHGFRDVKNNVNLYTRMLAFFDRHIGDQRASAQAATP